MNEVIVVGFGNVLMGDEGVGCRLVERLAARRGEIPGVDLMDLGTSGMKLLHLMPGRQKVVIVDCALMREPPGTLRRFTPAEIREKNVRPRLSLHEGSLMDVLDLARSLGEAKAEIVIFGIEPKVVAPGDQLSATLSSRLDEYASIIEKELLH